MKRPSYILRGAKLHSMVDEPREEALLVDDGWIRERGSQAELSCRAPAAETVDLQGATLFPGFIDTHTHFFEWARKLSGVDLTGTRSLKQVERRLRPHLDSELPRGVWLGGSGWSMHHLSGDAKPDRAFLDGLFPDRPVALESQDFHTLWCNTAALKAAGVLDAATAPAGGEIGRRSDGAPDGLLYETAWELVLKARPKEPEEIRQRWLRKAIELAHRFGVTSFHSMEPRDAYHSYAKLAREGKLAMRVVHHSPVAELEERIQRSEASYSSEDPWLRPGGVKIFVDGSLGSASAYMTEPYPGGGYGRRLIEQDELIEIIVRAGRNRIAPSIHAIGDAAVRLVVGALERAQQTLRRQGLDLPRLSRIEHAQCVSLAELPRLAELGVVCAMQLIHLADDVPLLKELWPELGSRAYPTRDLLDRGIRVVLGSDCPVASIDPRLGICAAMARRAGNRPEGESWTVAQALSQEEALLAYTRWAAEASAWENELGTLAVGTRADCVALDAPQAEDPFAWPKARVRMTMVDGQIVYDDLP